MGIRHDDHTAAYAFLAAIGEGSDLERAPGPASHAGATGGPLTADAWRFRRAPTPHQLVESYRQAIYACVEINAATVSSVPLRLYATTTRGQAKPRSFAAPRPVGPESRRHLGTLPYLARTLAAADDVDEVGAHPLLDLIDDPNEEFDRPSLLHFVCACLDVVGTAYLRPTGAPGLPPGELWPLPPADVHPVRSGLSAIPDAFTYAGETIPRAELIRIRLASLKDPYGSGYAPAQAAFAYGNLEEVWVATRDQLLRRGPKPSAIVGPVDPKFPFGEGEAKRLQTDLNRNHAGPAGGGIVVSSTGYTYNPITHKPTDLGETIGPDALQAIANCFGIPVAFLVNSTNLANLQASEIQHGRRAVNPRCTRIAAVLTRWARSFDPRLFFAFDSATPEDEDRRSLVDERYVRAKVYSVNDVRLKLGYAPVSWGDEPWVPSSERQPSEDRPEPTPPAKDDDATAKALMAEASTVLRSIKVRLNADESDDGPDDYGGLGDHCCGDRGPGPDPGDAGPPEEAEAQTGEEHLRPPPGGGDRADAEAVVQAPGEGDPGLDPDAGHGDPDGLPAAD